MSFERFLRLVHGWMGVLILPWVVLAGFTGLYMNHADLMQGILPATEFDVSRIDAVAGAKPQDLTSAHAVAARAMPEAAITLKAEDSFLHRSVFYFVAGAADVVVDKATGAYWLIGRYQRSLVAPDGQMMQRQIRWDRVMNNLHADGWLGKGAGSWPADIAAVALMVFGVSGLYIFAAPRLRRVQFRRGQAARGKAPPE